MLEILQNKVEVIAEKYADLEDYDDGTPVYDFVKWLLNGLFIVAGPAVICWLGYIIGRAH